MAAFPDYDSYDALGLAALVRSSEVTPAALVDEAIARCERVNPRINAVITPMYAIARAAAADPVPPGPFGGVPFLLKDLAQAWAGQPLRNGCRYYQNYVPAHDSEMVRRFRAAGLIVFDKTNTPELGLMGSTEPELFGPTRNPWDLALTAGGSSGGAAAAVAAGIVPMAGGGDGGGSLRIPASCCGVVGLKPSRGRNPAGPVSGEPWFGQVQEGVITRSVRDAAAALDATAGGDAGCLYSAPPPARPFLDEIGRDPGKLRIAVCRRALLSSAPIDAACLAGLDLTVALLEADTTEKVTPPLDASKLATGYLMRVAAATGAELRQARTLIGSKPTRADFELETRALANLGRCFSAVDLAESHALIEQEICKMGQFMQAYDVFLTPTLATPPAPLGVFKARGADRLIAKISALVPLGPLAKIGNVLEQLADSNFRFVVSTPLANLTGEPAITLPLHWTPSDLPVGMMFSAKIYQEATLLRLASQLEQARPWHGRRPPVHAGEL